MACQRVPDEQALPWMQVWLLRHVSLRRVEVHVQHRPLVLRWGLTRCNNGACLRLWDRDVNTTWNILWTAVLQLVYNHDRVAHDFRSFVARAVRRGVTQ